MFVYSREDTVTVLSLVLINRGKGIYLLICQWKEDTF